MISISRRIWPTTVLLVTVLVCWQLGGWFGYRMLEQESLKESYRYGQLVENELNRYRPIPELMAEHPLLGEALQTPDNAQLILQANEQMRQMAEAVNASDVYLVDLAGLTIAHSNYLLESSFIGRNFEYRPYFQEAVRNGETAVYFALGITSGVRGLYFSHPVRSSRGDILGVVVAKMLVDELENQWQHPATFSNAEMVVVDGNGIGFLSSRQEWLYRDFRPESSPGKESLAVRQRYPGMPLEPVKLVDLGHPLGVSERSRLVRIPEAGMGSTYLSVQTPLPQLDWSLKVMLGTDPVWWTRVRFLLVGVALFSGGFLTWLYLRERYRREAELAERGVQLEQRVAERTADLESSNRRLLEEVQQRERAQRELRETQQELIQAAKLAVLGQMSAGLNHELNQPLTAIQSYARNSRRFLQRGQPDIADANLEEIGQLCNKMAELIRQFKVFARKSEGPPAVVDLRLPIDGALKIIRAQSVSEGVEFLWDRPEVPIMCHGDLIRVEQVLVNLLANAVQAVSDSPRPSVEVSVSEVDGGWCCMVRDNGPGLPGNTEQVFEPFFTTKSVHQGLGLGLSISRQIVDALGGRLTGRNRELGPGAEFIMVLDKRDATE